MTFAKNLCLTAVLCLLSGLARADIYAFIDENGSAHYSNIPQEGYTLFKREPTPTVSDSEPLTPARIIDPPRLIDTSKAVAESPSLQKRRKQYAKLVAKAAKDAKVSAALLDAVITAESGYQADSVSPKGALGMMQLMPQTAVRYGVKDPLNAEQNIRGGARYLADLLRMFDNNLELAVAAYNAGEGSVIRAGYSIPKYKETQAYVPKVLGTYTRQQGRVKVTLMPDGGRTITAQY